MTGNRVAQARRTRALCGQGLWAREQRQRQQGSSRAAAGSPICTRDWVVAACLGCLPLGLDGVDQLLMVVLGNHLPNFGVGVVICPANIEELIELCVACLSA